MGRRKRRPQNSSWNHSLTVRRRRRWVMGPSLLSGRLDCHRGGRARLFPCRAVGPGGVAVARGPPAGFCGHRCVWLPAAFKRAAMATAAAPPATDRTLLRAARSFPAASASVYLKTGGLPRSSTPISNRIGVLRSVPPQLERVSRRHRTVRSPTGPRPSAPLRSPAAPFPPGPPPDPAMAGIDPCRRPRPLRRPVFETAARFRRTPETNR